MLSDTKKDCVEYAKMLGDYQSMGINYLADMYCDAKDNDKELEKSEYFSALVLRFWYTIDKLYQKSSGAGVDREECFMWLAEAIEYACKYRAWQNPEKHCNAQQAINMCIETIRKQHYYEFNLQKQRLNYNTVSLDTPIGDNGDDRQLSDIVVGDNEDLSADMNVTGFIQSYINKKKIVEAIILDSIIVGDVMKEDKKTVKDTDELGKTAKYTRYSSKFWPYKLVQFVSTLPDNYDKYFSKKYKIATHELDAALSAVRTANNQKLYKYLDKTLEEARLDYML